MTEINITNSSIDLEKSNLKSVISKQNDIIDDLTNLNSKLPLNIDFTSLSAAITSANSISDDLIKTRSSLLILEALITGQKSILSSGNELGTIKKIQINEIDYTIIKNDGYKAQGYTVVGNHTYISAHGGDNENSRLYIYNTITGEYEGTIILNSTSHVGGITYDKENGILYVSGVYDKKNDEGTIETYNINELNKAIEDVTKDTKTFTLDLSDGSVSNGSSIKIENDIKIPGESPATIIYKNGKLSVTTFGTSLNPGETFNYDVNYNSKNKTFSSKLIETNKTVPRLVQGMDYITYKGKEYYVYAQSIKGSNSSLAVYEKNSDGDYKFVGKKYYSHDGLEGIQIDDNGNIKGVFEYDDQVMFEETMDNLLENMSTFENPFTEIARDIGSDFYDAENYDTPDYIYYDEGR